MTDFNKQNLLFVDPEELIRKQEEIKMQYLSSHLAPITKGSGKDGRWFTRVPDPSYKSGYKMIRKQSKEEVEKELLYYYAAKESGQLALSDMTVAVLFEKWMEYKKKNPSLQLSTFQKYRTDYVRFIQDTEFESMQIKDVTCQKIEKFLFDAATEHHLKARAATTLSGYLRGMFSLACRNEWIKNNPFDAVDLHNNIYPYCCHSVQKERILTVEEVSHLQDILKKRHETYPLYIPDYGIEICLWTGLRVGEVSALSWDDIESNELIISHSERCIPDKEGRSYVVGDTKNHKIRKVPICPSLQDIFNRLQEIYQKERIKSDYILCDHSGRITSPKISNAAIRRGKEAGIKNCSIHQIRRTVSSRLNTVYDRATVSDLMGHTENVNLYHYDYDTVFMEHKRQTLEHLYNKP